MSEVIDFFNMFAQNIILIVVFYMYLQGNTKLNSIFTISILMSYLLPAISNIVKVNLNLREVKASREFLQLVEDEQEQSGDIKIDHIDDVAVDMEKGLSRKKGRYHWNRGGVRLWKNDTDEKYFKILGSEYRN